MILFSLPGRSRCSPSELAGSLALLRDAPAGAAEATIALLPYERRRELAVRGVVEAVDTSADKAAAVRVTEYGQRLICDS
jgi:hypothetical protein